MSSLPALDYGLGETIDMLRDTVQRFARGNEIAPIALRRSMRTNEFPRRAVAESSVSWDLLGMTVEPEYGGSGLGYLAHCVAMEEISRRFCRPLACPTERIRIFV